MAPGHCAGLSACGARRADFPAGREDRLHKRHILDGARGAGRRRRRGGGRGARVAHPRVPLPRGRAEPCAREMQPWQPALAAFQGGSPKSVRDSWQGELADPRLPLHGHSWTHSSAFECRICHCSSHSLNQFHGIAYLYRLSYMRVQSNKACPI